MSQSRHMSLIEAVTNVVVGYVLAVATQIVVFPWFGLQRHLSDPQLRTPAVFRASAVMCYPIGMTMCKRCLGHLVSRK
jgi:hypothetical protein